MPSIGTYDERRQNRWYFGGIASACAVCLTHPLELLKVLLQTQSEKPLTLNQLAVQIFRTEGVWGFYNGISAALMRQLTFTLVRIGIYEHFKYNIPSNSTKLHVALAIVSGSCGALVGMPCELVNVRMQNDMRLPLEQRRNYKHVFDGFARVLREDGFKTLYTGAVPNMFRGIMQTLSSNIVYDQVKCRLLDAGFEDTTKTHFICSFTAAITATTAVTPIDVIKSRMMNPQPGIYTGFLQVFKYTAQQGPMAFYRGYLPAIIRTTPHTIIFFLIMEQMRLHFGHLPTIANKDTKT